MKALSTLQKYGKPAFRASKAQLSIEYMLMIGVGFIILIFAAMFIGDHAVMLSKERELTTIKDFSYSLQNELYFVARAGHGFKREIFIPEKLHGISFNIQNTGKELILTSQNYDFGLVLPETQGNLHKGTNIMINNQGKVCIDEQC